MSAAVADVAIVATAPVPAALDRPPLSARLRRLVINVAGEATLSCRFSPGGRVRGAGIVSHLHCVHCNQSLMWHEVAEAIPLLAVGEDLARAATRAEGSV